MSENQASVEDGVSAGALLKHARESAGLHVATLAANLKVPVRKLEALEEDRYDELPDAVFVRALASSVCRTLKIDPAPVLLRLPQTPQPRLAETGQQINAPFRSPSDGPAPGLLQQVSRPVVLIVLALLLGALVLIFLPVAQRGIDTVMQANRSEPAPAVAPTTDARPEQPTTAPATASASIEGLPAAPASAAGPVPTPAAVTQAPEAAAGRLPATSPGASTGAGAAAPSGAATIPGATAAAAATAPATAGSGSADASGVVVFRARAESWVQVKDASGATVLQKLLQAGESAGASGALPLSVIVGSAQATEVQVRGKPLDLARLARDNVARFEVK